MSEGSRPVVDPDGEKAAAGTDGAPVGQEAASGLGVAPRRDGPVGAAAEGGAVGDESAASGGGAATRACVVCGADLVADARFCEACGDDVTTAADESSGAGAAEPDPAFGTGAGDEPGSEPPAGGPSANGGNTAAAGVSTVETEPPAAGAGACSKCGAEVGADGYCTSCGHRALEPVTVDDRGPMAYAGHRGRRHPRNEDSCALGLTSEGWPVLVVSDGVSVSPNPHKASAAAVTAATRRLAGRPFGGPDELVAAVADAHRAASAIDPEGDPLYPADGTHAACTIVVAVATPDAVHVANVGDARAHLVTAAAEGWSATQLSTDDSVAAHAVSQGIEVEVALALPGGHGITAWLGADAHEPSPHVATRAAEPGDVLLATSDGLWNYAATDESLGGLLSATLAAPGDLGREPLGAPCERLVAWANDQGGADNITVALAPVPLLPPAASPGGAGHDPDLDPDPSELEDDP